MKKYLTIFKISWQKELTYSFNFLLWRLRSLIVMALFYYVWLNLAKTTGNFAGFSLNELIIYVIGANILRSLIFGAQSRSVAQEINEGKLSKYLIMPVNYFWYEFTRQLAERTMNFFASAIEISLFIILVKPPIYYNLNPGVMVIFVLSTGLAIMLYYLLSYLISLIAFWSREAMGPRFLFEWLLELTSGAYFPLNILGQLIFTMLKFLPFMYLIYAPLIIYLNKINTVQVWQILSAQAIFIILLAILVKLVWQKGLKKYSGEGM